MVMRLSLFVFSLTAALGACSPMKQQPHPPAPANQPPKPIQSTSKLPDLATKPDGGVRIERKEPLTPEENMARVRANALKPVVFGKTAGGISFETTFEESLDILSDPTGASENMYFYNEGIRVAWAEKDPRNPELFVVAEGYLGVFELPERFKDVRIGSSFAEYFKETDPKTKPGSTLIKELDRFFYKRAAGYDCLAKNKCAVQAEGDSIVLGLESGGFYFSADAEHTLTIAFFRPPPPPPTPAVTDPIVLSQSIGGVKLGISIEELIKLRGEPLGKSSTGALLYDNSNMAIGTDNPDTPTKVVWVQAQGEYAGKLTLPAKFGEVKIGSSFKTHFPATDAKGEGLIRELARVAENKDAAYDCVKDATCKIEEDEESFVFMIKGSILIFEKTDEKPLVMVRVLAE